MKTEIITGNGGYAIVKDGKQVWFGTGLQAVIELARHNGYHHAVSPVMRCLMVKYVPIGECFTSIDGKEYRVVCHDVLSNVLCESIDQHREIFNGDVQVWMPRACPVA